MKGKSEEMGERGSAMDGGLHISRPHLQGEEAAESRSRPAEQTSVNALQLAGLGKTIVWEK